MVPVLMAIWIGPLRHHVTIMMQSEALMTYYTCRRNDYPFLSDQSNLSLRRDNPPLVTGFESRNANSNLSGSMIITNRCCVTYVLTFAKEHRKAHSLQ
jgi:hypothetical protein